MLILMMAYNATQRLEHIEKHVAETRRLIDVLVDGEDFTERTKVAGALIQEFNIIKSDAEAALFLLGGDAGF